MVYKAPLFPLPGVPAQPPWERGRSKKASVPPDTKGSRGTIAQQKVVEGEVLPDQAHLHLTEGTQMCVWQGGGI